MDYTNITLWSETVAFPLLSIMTLTPLIAMVIVLFSSSSVTALRVGFVGTMLTIVMSIYLLAVFDADLPGIQLFEQVQSGVFPTLLVLMAPVSCLFR